MTRRPPIFAALAAVVSLAAPALAQPPSMDALWPNEDGRSWLYDQHYESFVIDPMVVNDQIRVYFDGTTVAPVGIVAQYLRQEWLGGAAPALESVVPVPGAFLRGLWLARPDLRASLLQAQADAPCPQFHPAGSWSVLFGGEFAYLKTADEIAAWRCNLANTRSWRWLVADLTIGNTFELQLLPDLASDVILRGTIAAIEPATTPAGTFNGCVRVDYVVDYGTSSCTDPGGSEIGTSRGETRGSIHFAPFVGPVQSYEETIPYVEATGTCAPPGDIGRVYSLVSLRLATDPVPVRPMSWGRLKTGYR